MMVNDGKWFVRILHMIFHKSSFLFRSPDLPDALLESFLDLLLSRIQLPFVPVTNMENFQIFIRVKSMKSNEIPCVLMRSKNLETKTPWRTGFPRWFCLGGGRLQFQLSPGFTHGHAHSREAGVVATSPCPTWQAIVMVFNSPKKWVVLEAITSQVMLHLASFWKVSIPLVSWMIYLPFGLLWEQGQCSKRMYTGNVQYRWNWLNQ